MSLERLAADAELKLKQLSLHANGCAVCRRACESGSREERRRRCCEPGRFALDTWVAAELAYRREADKLEPPSPATTVAAGFEDLLAVHEATTRGLPLGVAVVAAKRLSPHVWPTFAPRARGVRS